MSLFKAADSRPLGIGKKYQAIYDLPLIGECSVCVEGEGDEVTCLGESSGERDCVVLMGLLQLST